MFDRIQDSWLNVVFLLFAAGCLIFVAYVVVAIIGATIGRFGPRETFVTALFIGGCAGSIVVLGLLRNRVHKQNAQRPSPMHPESGLEVPLIYNIRPVGPLGLVADEVPETDDWERPTEDNRE